MFVFKILFSLSRVQYYSRHPTLLFHIYIYVCIYLLLLLFSNKIFIIIIF